MTGVALTQIPSQLSVGSVTVTGSTAPTNGIALFNTNVLGFYTGSAVRATVNASGQFVMSGGAGGAILPTTSGTAPSLVPRFSDTTTGVGSQASGNMSFIAGGAEISRVTANGTVTIQQTLVSALPAAATAGAGTRRFVTDGLAPTFAAAVTGGGAVFTPVYSDGTIWRCG